jgi:protein involved in polysaccharide export with SLBB domain
LVNKKDRVSDIIQRAGGLTLGWCKRVRIKRPIQANKIEDLENVNLNLGKRQHSE